MSEERRETKRWLRSLREQRGWSQADVADLLGVSRETIGALENEKRGFANGFTLVKYLRLLGALSSDAPLEDPARGRLGALEAEVADLRRSQQELASAADVERGFRALEAAIERLAPPRTREASPDR